MNAVANVLDRFATRVARTLLAWLVSRVEPARSEWLTGMQGELEAIDDWRAKLAWALGALSLTWSLNRHRLAPAIARQLTGGPIKDQAQFEARPWVDTLVLNAVTLVVWWMLFGLIVVQSGGMRSWTSGESFILIACSLGAVAGLAMRMRGAAYVLAGFAAFQAVELALHLVYGISVVQGGPVHFANMAAGILSVTWGAYIVRNGLEISAPAWNPSDVLGSAVRIGAALRRRIGIAVVVPVAFVVFAMVEAGMRVAFGMHPLRDNMSNFAILLCALIGALLGLLAGATGERLVDWRVTKEPVRSPEL